MAIDRPNQVWCADITFVPVKNGFLYLVAIMNWATRKVLSWRLERVQFNRKRKKLPLPSVERVFRYAMNSIELNTL